MGVIQCALANMMCTDKFDRNHSEKSVIPGEPANLKRRLVYVGRSCESVCMTASVSVSACLSASSAKCVTPESSKLQGVPASV